jgi:hypothetical protein
MGPQMPLTHTAEQQLPTDGHGSPFGVQAVASHVPCVQMLEQQSLANVQLAPSAPQLEPHLPWLQIFEQQSLDRVHVDPSGAHEGAHVPLLQTFEQQSAESTHVSPSWPHVPHVPLLQTFEQQFEESWQLAPMAAQGTSHAPFWQVRPLQQPPAQLWPSAPQSVQTEFAQVPLQHSENAAHASPPGLHIGPPVVVLLLLLVLACEPPAPAPPSSFDPPLPQAWVKPRRRTAPTSNQENPRIKNEVITRAGER